VIGEAGLTVAVSVTGLAAVEIAVVVDFARPLAGVPAYDERVTSSRSLETLTADDFHDHRNTRFRVTGGASEVGPSAFELELVEVAEYPAASPGTFRSPFSVLFHGPLEPVLPQGIYRLEHERFGALELFIAPVGPQEPSAAGEKPRAMRYESVFG